MKQIIIKEHHVVNANSMFALVKPIQYTLDIIGWMMDVQ